MSPSPVVSVIVPVYNREKYIQKCVDSILLQTYKNFELILVDDGSRDNSFNICKTYEAKDSRVNILHQENGGVSSARNLGIEHAHGRWICFVDSDDYVTENYIESLIKMLEKYENKPTLFALKGIIRWNKEFRLFPQPLYTGSEILKARNDAPWGKLYDKHIIDAYNVKFPIGIRAGEDFIFNCNYAMHIDGIVTIDSYDYVYNPMESVIAGRFFSLEEAWNHYISVKSAWEKLMDKYGITDRIDKMRCLWESPVSHYFESFMLNSKSSITYIAESEFSADIDDYTKYTPTKNIRKRISLFLLKNKMFRTYVAYNRIIMNVRRIILPLYMKFNSRKYHLNFTHKKH